MVTVPYALLFIDFQMMGQTLRLKLWIPKNWPKWHLCCDIENYVATLFCLSSSFFSWLAVLCRYILLCLVLELCQDRVLLNLSCTYYDMSVLCRYISLVPCSLNTQMVCRDIKALLQQSFLLAALDYVAT